MFNSNDPQQINDALIQSLILGSNTPENLEHFTSQFNVTVGDVIYILSQLKSGKLFPVKMLEVIMKAKGGIQLGLSADVIIQSVFLEGLITGYSIRLNEEVEMDVPNDRHED